MVPYIAHSRFVVDADGVLRGTQSDSVLIHAEEFGGDVDLEVGRSSQIRRVLFAVFHPELSRRFTAVARPALQAFVGRHGDRPLAVFIDQGTRNRERAVLECESIVLEGIPHQLWEFSDQGEQVVGQNAAGFFNGQLSVGDGVEDELGNDLRSLLNGPVQCRTSPSGPVDQCVVMLCIFQQ